MLEMEIISCGNITDKGIIALHHLRYVVSASLELDKDVKMNNQNYF